MVKSINLFLFHPIRSYPQITTKHFHFCFTLFRVSNHLQPFAAGSICWYKLLFCLDISKTLFNSLLSEVCAFLFNSSLFLRHPRREPKIKNKKINTINKGEKTNMSFTGTLDKCTACDKTVYVVDLLTLEGITYHKNCFKCSHCKGCLTVHIVLHFLVPFLGYSPFNVIIVSL